MSVTRTGLIDSQINALKRPKKKPPPHLLVLAKPAPYTLKPFAALYNPYEPPCSLLCNHPLTNLPPEVKDEEIKHEPVPEELFRRYTQTDSRPLTPTPTLTSVTTTALSRRCITPEPRLIKPKLVVDLRRTHSQELVSWSQEKPAPDTPSSYEHTAVSDEGEYEVPELETNLELNGFVLDQVISSQRSSPRKLVTQTAIDEPDDRRRGKKRRPKDATIVASNEPLTQVNALEKGKVVEHGSVEIVREVVAVKPFEKSLRSRMVKSFLDVSTLVHLQRLLSRKTIENEFHDKKKIILEEAYRCMRSGSDHFDGFKQDGNSGIMRKWLELPKTFTKQSSRFELPVVRAQLKDMNVMDYVSTCIYVFPNRKILYDYEFNRCVIVEHEIIEHQRRQIEEKSGNKVEQDERKNAIVKDVPIKMDVRQIDGKYLYEALVNLMGYQYFDRDYFEELSDYLDLNVDDKFNFRTFCGIAAVCERLLYCKLYKNFASAKFHRKNEIEEADFQFLSEILERFNLNEKLKRLLYFIRDT